MKLRLLALALLGLLFVPAAGCSKRYRIEIQSDVCWYGTVNDNQGISGCGNVTYKVVGRLGCVRIQKSGGAGYVRVRIDDGPWVDSSDVNGLVQVCQ